jgi:hypothetical protein
MAQRRAKKSAGCADFGGRPGTQAETALWYPRILQNFGIPFGSGRNFCIGTRVLTKGVI